MGLTWKAVAHVSCVSHLPACTTIEAGWWRAGYVNQLAVAARKTGRAVTLIWPGGVHTQAFILAGRGGRGTLIGVIKAMGAMVTRGTGTGEIPVWQSLAGTSVGTRAGQTSVLVFTMLTWKEWKNISDFSLFVQYLDYNHYIDMDNVGINYWHSNVDKFDRESSYH